MKHVYEACVLLSLLYSLETVWPTKAERQRLNGFHARCLRRIYGTRHAYYSRVSNADVLQMASSKPLSNMLLAKQLHLLARIASRPSGDPVRDSVFDRGSFDLVQLKEKRRVGRPRLAWGRCVYEHALKLAGSAQNLGAMLAVVGTPADTWKTRVRAYTDKWDLLC